VNAPTNDELEFLVHTLSAELVIIWNLRVSWCGKWTKVTQPWR
jgi:hypothetical protein